MIGQHLEQYTFEYILQSALSRVGDDVDKREGSVIYDAIAPACYELAQAYGELRAIYRNTFADTAEGAYLDKRAAEQGLTRRAATAAVREGSFVNQSGQPMDIPLGSRFATASDTESVIFTAAARTAKGIYTLSAETPGAAGNEYTGALLPVTNINGLGSAEIGAILIPGEDAQSDESLRREYFEFLRQKPFGGNLAQYKSELEGMDGVGAAQVYPVWDGGGTVKCSIITSEYRAAGPALLEVVQDTVDPRSEGKGLGTAPIGHRVTIAAPAEAEIDISAEITTAAGVSPAQLLPDIKEEIEAYFLSVRKSWGQTADSDNHYSLYIFMAQVSACILRVNGVLNVSDLTLNGQASDIVLTQDALLQELPILGVVDIA